MSPCIPAANLQFMNKAQAKQRAIRHLKTCVLMQKNFVWIVGDPKDLKDGWYFDYQSKPKGEVLHENWDTLGGLPGFIVDKESGDVRDVSWNEYHQEIETEDF